MPGKYVETLEKYVLKLLSPHVWAANHSAYCKAPLFSKKQETWVLSIQAIGLKTNSLRLSEELDIMARLSS